MFSNGRPKRMAVWSTQSCTIRKTSSRPNRFVSLLVGLHKPLILLRSWTSGGLCSRQLELAQRGWSLDRPWWIPNYGPAQIPPPECLA